MSEVRALLVDLDGTLVATEDANFAAYAQALAAVGVPIERARFDASARGRNWRQFLPELLQEAGVNADPALIAEDKARLYRSKLSCTVVNQPLAQLIRAARGSMRTALVTTASGSNARAVLDHHQLGELFDLIVTGSDVTRHKPHPEAYQLAADRLGVPPHQCVIIEDSDIGVASARAFGGSCIRIQFP